MSFSQSGVFLHVSLIAVLPSQSEWPLCVEPKLGLEGFNIHSYRGGVGVAL
ncbi:hypothetical protein E2542_SST02930 [Spatholobus suberectus]|nr:hypothetical protein E2542_SST02930 [Spatholobus suberectus]